MDDIIEGGLFRYLDICEGDLVCLDIGDLRRVTLSPLKWLSLDKGQIDVGDHTLLLNQLQLFVLNGLFEEQVRQGASCTDEDSNELLLGVGSHPQGIFLELTFPL